MTKKAIFVMLLIWATPLHAKEIETTETNTSNPKHEQQTNLKNEVEANSINNAPVVKNDKESFINKMQQLQYTQLLEIHRSYFTVFLQVVAVYLAVMGACMSIVNDSIRKLKKKDENGGSKTVLIALILFSLVASVHFSISLHLGLDDANNRNAQIYAIEEKLQIADSAGKPIIKHIGTKLFRQVIFAMMIVTAIIIIFWIVILVRGHMLCLNILTFQKYKTDIKERITKRFKAGSK